jgi:UDP-N-acetylglucosamine--N-acetylmuramyl-(pentapeptide) pyrophosphoryl-undecaprenol N-acetylglucosamine transferase
MNTSAQKIMLVAGGTGGHVFPAVALAHELTQQGIHISFITDRRGQRYVADLSSAVALRVIPLGSKQNGIWGQLLFLYELMAAFVSSLLFILKENPKKIIGYGGYPSFPGMLAGLLLGKKLYASEQDAVLGSMNQKFARFYRRIYLATPLLKPLKQVIAQKCKIVGLPVRSSIAALTNHLYQPPEKNGTFNLTVIGGSQGASVFSDVIPDALQRLPAALKKRLRVIQQCREAEVEQVKQKYRDAGIVATVRPFFDQMDQILTQTHLMISRSGASTVAEVIAASVPTIFVPFPHASHDHQTANASLLVSQGAGWLISQDCFTVDRCCIFITCLMARPAQLLFASERLKLFSQKNVTQTLASHILSV